MNTLSTSSWKRGGSSILFDPTEIQELLKLNSMVSLREFLSWKDNLPDNPPIPSSSRTVLVCGLETVLETLSPAEAQEFLQKKIRPVIKIIQDVWTETGIVFGFAQGKQSFKEVPGSREEVLFLRSDNQEIRISEGLWDGTAELNMMQIVSSFISESQRFVLGYYVKRIS